MKTLDNLHTMSSREIAQLTGRPHNDVLKAIRHMETAWKKVTEGNFSLGYYFDANNQQRPMYQLSKKECLYIATKFNDEARARLVIRWEELENKKVDFSNPNTVLQLAQNWANEQNLRIAAESKIKQLAPKAELMNKILDADEKIDIGQAAKILELPFGRNTMFKQLRAKGVFFKNRNEPKQEFINRGLFVLKEKWIQRNNHEGFVVIKVLVTQKGLEYISNLFGIIKENKELTEIQ